MSEAIAEQRGYAAGLAEGRENTAELVKTLRLVQVMLLSKRIVAENPRDDNNPDAAPQTLEQIIDKALLPFTA